MDLFLVYLTCFGVGLLFTLVTAFMGHLSGGGHAHIDFSHDMHMDGAHGHAEAASGHDMPGFSPLSPVILASFVTAFGGFGMILGRIPFTESAWVSVPLSLLGGLAVAACVLWLFRAIFRHTQSSSESHVSTLPGLAAMVITPIPVSGVGEIAYVQAGSRYTAPARDEKGASIPTGATVKITRVLGTQFYVSLE
jgi:membrane protein implicated in regulation of membrane protease activity